VRLRLSAVTDGLADRVAQALDIDPDSANGEAVRVLAGAWRKAKFPTLEDELKFLDIYDVEYVWRALHYLYQKKGERRELSKIHEGLNGLMEADFKPLVDPGAIDLADLAIVVDPRAAAKAHLPPKPADCSEENDPWALDVLDRLQWRTRIDLLHDSLTMEIGVPLDALRKDLDTVMKENGGWRFFRAQDVLLFPVQFGTDLGETGEVDIVRISPVDACALPPRSANQSKLKGVLFGSFGGFLDKTWRYNDMLWGRLDGAERLITAVLPGSDEPSRSLRADLIAEAQFEIARDWERNLGKEMEEGTTA
jgi:hypothetical protein